MSWQSSMNKSQKKLIQFESTDKEITYMVELTKPPAVLYKR